MLNAISGAHYMEIDHVGDPGYTAPGKEIDRLQMELIASRVSAINECFY
jgi:alkylhydroperoxidase family enzyme